MTTAELLATCSGGIIFSGESVRAIRDGRKTQTRRVACAAPGELVKFAGFGAWFRESAMSYEEPFFVRARYQPRKRYYLKETWCLGNTVGGDAEHRYLYQLDNPDLRLVDGDGFGVYRKDGSEASPWLSPMRMPKDAARYVIEVDSATPQRLQNISPADIMAEGIDDRFDGEKGIKTHFADAWDSLNGKRAPWASNPWVWAYAFHLVQP
jgi:hypothetical protein